MNRASLPEEVGNYINNLENKNRSLETENVEIIDKNKSLETEISLIKEKYNTAIEELKMALHRKFGRSSESIDVKNYLLFDSEENLPLDVEQDDESPIEVKTHTRKKVGRKPLSERLPREEIIHDLSDEEKQCACGKELVCIGEEVSERLEIIPEQIYVKRHIRKKYACNNCEGSGDEDRPAVRIKPPVPSIIPKSIVTPGLLAFIFVNKYVDHLPFYRQEKRFERIGITISRQNMSNWQQKVYEKLSPLFLLMKDHLKTGTSIGMDETIVQVMKEADRLDTQKSYMWLAKGGPPERPVTIYQYRETRGSKHIHEFIDGFKGYLQSDGYRAYKTALEDYPEITHVGCLAHARRKFVDASKLTKKVSSSNEAINRIKKIYLKENQLRDLDLPETEFLERRRKEVLPLFELFHHWLLKKVDHVVPSSLLGKAMQYTLNEWDNLIAYLDCYDLTPDNNACENAIRPFVLGRKNWLFAGSPAGAKASCFIYSLIESAKQNGLNPYVYLKYVFEKEPLIKDESEWETLLPWNCV